MTILEIPCAAVPIAWLATIKALLSRYGERRKRRRALAQLYSVDSRTLKDIGIDRSELMSIVSGNASGRRRANVADSR